MQKATPKKTVTKKSKSAKTNTLSHLSNNLFIVGIGASAGGLEALKLFFNQIPPKNGMAFIVVQHLDPTHKSLLSELLAKHTKMPVVEISDQIKVTQDHVYVIPPNKDLRIINKTLLLIEPSEERPKRRPIDSFFHSLAVDQQDKAIGIVLSGTGTEGALGLKEIKAEGGITIVQDPKTAQFSGMPNNAISANAADFILSPEDMAKKLVNYIKKNSSTITTTDKGLGDQLQNQLNKIFFIIKNQTGYDFSNYKSNTIIRRINKRMLLDQIDTIDDYISFIQINPDEVTILYKDFLIGVTSFFRDKEVFKILAEKTIPYLLKNCAPKQELRVWICGCSTGEEAYSLAILFKEALKKNNQYIKVILFASDIDKDAVNFARNGIYADYIKADIDDELLSQYFLKQEHGYQVKKEIREMVIFAHHNLIKDPPFSKLDMISCRNLLIYINSDLQKKIIPVFHYSLNTDGILLLGTSESIGEYGDLFDVFDKNVKIFKRKDIPTRKPGLINELQFTENKAFLAEPFTVGTRKKTNISGITDKILIEQYAPPSVIIDKNNDALYFSGNTGLYLEPPSGIARFNILEMAKKGLRSSLENAIAKSRTNDIEIKQDGIEVIVGDFFKTINLKVKPLYSKLYDKGTLMIIFESVEKPITKQVASKTGKRKLVASELEKELKITREHLQIAIDELESSNEDLKNANEDFQSSNEELQSTNEELETSREELQSVNEELTTVNTELTDKIDQLSQSNNDLNNLLRSIEVATIYLDIDLKIKRFTPAATKIFNLIPSDIDRPVTQLASNLYYKSLAEDVKEALKTLAVKSIEVNAIDGAWYYMRIIPYRTADNIIEGVLVTLVEITEQKKVEQQLKKSNEHLTLIMENLPAVPYTCINDPHLKIDFVGNSAEKVTGFLPEQFTGDISFWLNRIHPSDKKKILDTFNDIKKIASYDLEFRWKCADGKYKSFINYMRYVEIENRKPAYIVGVWQELIVSKSIK
ncbi:chemotaxis protein CheB [Pedobacter cryophilus]|uniref:Chemotaxis protein CheB n=1 Tax=Pedobacter cryophilus TaxID=2571271 RepID=A0A4U1BUL1_9SPHI|nr:chemotaxis protein CheB [Pedobacter cryophilus]TKB96058.1 chemotaxis protein CheB [Pedobacter cryophilus]